MSPFIYIRNTNKRITTHYDTRPDNNEKYNVSVPIHQVQIPNKGENQTQRSK